MASLAVCLKFYCCVLCPTLVHETQSDMVPLLQIGFFNIVGIPLFKAMTDLFEDAQPMLDGVLTNFEMWKAGAEG